MYYTDKRHEIGGKPKPGAVKAPEDWSQRDRTKTVSAALLVCLNLGVDPPDIVKTNPSATMECWVDVNNVPMANSKILETIGRRLQDQYENLSIKTRYKQYLDPSIEETKKLTISLRRNAKDERVLFHYNGHGVPLPTPSGEIWVFNRDFTQYIPVALYDLQTWLAGPSLYVFDCSHAGNIVTNFEKNVEKHEAENAELRQRDPNAQLQNFSNNIQLAACGANELLPTNPQLPADLFTCCLTTPIQISIRYHLLQNPLQTDLSGHALNVEIPGRSSERRSPIGELNWILTAITDTIAWNALPRVLFRKLFRQDLMVAAVFRNFLVAERIMSAYGCHPISMPQIPSTASHILWQSWDLAVEMVLSQLPAMKLAAENPEKPYEYRHSTFFAEQLQAFDVYLQQGAPQQQLPTQLPIVLQVLLSQAHRLRALILLSKFLDLGPWAVNLALTIGIFPYVVKLLQSPALELKPIMIFIWARIIAVDQKQAQIDLLRDNGYQYFTHVLLPNNGMPVGNVGEHRAMSAFVIAMFCRDHQQAQTVCASPELIHVLISYLEDENPLLRQWSCLCISMLWANYPEAKWIGIRCNAHHRLCALVIDPVPEVRAAAIHALTDFLGIPDLTIQVAQNEELIASALMSMAADGSSIVRRELVVFYSCFVKRYCNKFIVSAFETLAEELAQVQYPEKEFFKHRNEGTDTTDERVSKGSVQGAMWFQLLVLTVDAHPDVAQLARVVVEYVHEMLLESPLARSTKTILDSIIEITKPVKSLSRPPSVAPSTREPRGPATSGSTTSLDDQKNEGYLSMGMRRTASVANALKYLVGASTPAPPEHVASKINAAQRNAQANRNPGPVRKGVPAEWSTPPDQNDHTVKATNYQPARLPMPRDFKEEKISPGKVSLPLKSNFFEWSIEYFREPQMKPNEPDEPGSDDYNSRLWRRNRNERALLVTQPLKNVAGTSRWDIDAGFLNNGNQPTKMSFHQFEDHLAIADDHGTISVWNWARPQQLSRFSNGNPRGSRINEARFINEDDQGMLVTSSSDGVIKLFRNYWSDKDVELVSAFRALTDLIPSDKNAGTVFDWQQGQGKFLVAGDVKVIRVWNAATEICTNDIPARSGSCITSLTSDAVAGQIFAAGYGDGAIRVFDQRLKPQEALVRTWRDHKQWITNVHLQRGGLRELVSGARNGSVRLWDIRMEKPLREIQGLVGTGGGEKGLMRTLSVHEHAPVFAT